MNENVILVAETGSDLPKAMAEELGVYLVPMHVQMGDKTLDDGTFSPEEICAWYDSTGTVPTTSASTPYDFETVFDEIHQKYPQKKILHLAYSAVTTCSYANAQLAAEGRDYVRSLDTKHVSVGQGAVVAAVAKWLKENPQATLEEAAAYTEAVLVKTQMSFIPNNLNYLRAGGRVSNAVALVGNLLHLHPVIEIIDGRLIAGKKYRGDIRKVVPTLIRDFAAKHDLNKDHVYLIHSPYLAEEAKQIAENTCAELGIQKISWLPTGCVITCHCGPGAFGIVGCAK